MTGALTLFPLLVLGFVCWVIVSHPSEELPYPIREAPRNLTVPFAQRAPDAPPARMDPEVRRRWLEALRSGEYAQGIGYLRSVAGFCPLGVLLDVSSDNLEGTWNPVATNHYSFDLGGDRLLKEIPSDFFGISEKNLETIMACNDRYRYSFDVIATWIENNVP